MTARAQHVLKIHRGEFRAGADLTGVDPDPGDPISDPESSPLILTQMGVFLLQWTGAEAKCHPHERPWIEG
jgi:hypothetical protein